MFYSKISTLKSSQTNTMKFALLKYKAYDGIFNIGDYIQSLAANQFLPKVDELISREELDSYNGDHVKMIMNGWFLHEPKHWPPSDKIIPLFVSFHLNSVSYSLLEKEDVIRYFKKHEPIGCRDHETVRKLNSKGIKAFFSGCLTLTLGNTYMTKIRNSEIYFVDPHFKYKKNIASLISYLVILISNYSVVSKISYKLLSKNNFINMLKSAAFYIQYSKVFDNATLMNSFYITHYVRENNFKNEDEKFNYARMLLKKYSEAKLVITSRIHCALPCLSMETPVLYIDDMDKELTSSCRLDGIFGLFNIIKYNNGKLEPINLDIEKIRHGEVIKNKNTYKKLKAELTTKCQVFIG